MADEKKLVNIEGVKAEIGLGSWFAHIPVEIRTMIGLLLVFFLFIGGLQIVTKVTDVFGKKCWELQFKDDRVFRLNACNGTVVELDKNTMQPKAP